MAHTSGKPRLIPSLVAAREPDEEGPVVPFPLADELFLMSHDLSSGKARLSETQLGVGLAAALLGELTMASTFVLFNGRITLSGYAPPPERLCQALYEQTRSRLQNEDISLEGWLLAYRRLVIDLVADRMVRSGDLHRDVRRRMGRVSTRFLPLKPSEAFIRTQRLTSYLRNQVPLDDADTLLAGIVRIAFDGAGPLELDAARRADLDHRIQALNPPLQTLLEATETGIVTAIRKPHA